MIFPPWPQVWKASSTAGVSSMDDEPDAGTVHVFCVGFAVRGWARNSPVRRSIVLRYIGEN